ncbi:MAG: 4'-phosphopantetheinyl transferase EntD [Zhongshania sp.]|jgi:4'-phosphopantetheinyl transferase EntD|nr:4'-phosphopantetheinyl transferase superfamily protein [Zhongshania sp.]
MSAFSQFITRVDNLSLRAFSGVGIHCRFDETRYSELLFPAYEIELPAVLAAASNTRKAEFLAGRVAAKYALTELGLMPDTIGIGKHRNPLWPHSVLGSISHHRGNVFCLMMRRPVTGVLNIALGIDVESMMSLDDAMRLGASVCSADERRLAAQHFSDQTLSLTLIFSAKEALFKALYPLIGSYFDFLDVRVSGINIPRKELQLTLNRDLSSCLLRGQTMTAHWRETPKSVMTWVHPN